LRRCGRCRRTWNGTPVKIAGQALPRVHASFVGRVGSQGLETGPLTRPLLRCESDRCGAGNAVGAGGGGLTPTLRCSAAGQGFLAGSRHENRCLVWAAGLSGAPPGRCSFAAVFSLGADFGSGLRPPNRKRRRQAPRLEGRGPLGWAIGAWRVTSRWSLGRMLRGSRFGVGPCMQSGGGQESETMSGRRTVMGGLLKSPPEPHVSFSTGGKRMLLRPRGHS